MPAFFLERFLCGIEYTGYLVDCSSSRNARRSILDAMRILIRHFFCDSIGVWHSLTLNEHVHKIYQGYQNIALNIVSQFYMMRQFTELSLPLAGSAPSFDTGICQRPCISMKAGLVIRSLPLGIL